MSSDSSSDNESNRSHSPTPAVASTPGHGLERSPGYDTKSQENSPEREGARSSAGQSRRSRSSSRSSAASGRSGSHRSPSPAHSNRSGSAASKRSGSGNSRRSASVGSARSGSRSKSGSPASKRSGSPNSNRPTSAASKRSASADSHRSDSQVSKRSRAESQNSKRSGSPASRRSRSGSRRSGSATSNRSRSGSVHSRSRSGSAVSKRSGSATSRKSRSRSRSQDRSGSNSPNLQIDEPGSPAVSNKSVENEGKKKSRVLQSDSENDEGEGNAEKEGVSAAAIFGDDADDISEDSEEEKMKDTSDKEDERRRSRSRSGDEDDRKSEQDNEQQTVMDDEDDKENEPEPIPETRIDVEVPKISCDLGRDINFVKLPNFLSVETRPFDPETYEDEIDEEETLDEEGRARLKLKVENTIRWREAYDEEGNLKKESNARIVRWSDGSYSLHLGSEIFDVYRQPLQGDHNHLFIRQGTGLQGQAVFRTKLSFRPHSTESFTHRKMTLSLADRSQKTTGIKILSQVGVDPDHDKAERLKKEEEKLRQSARPKTTQRKKNDISRSHATSNIYREEEGSEDEGGISLNAIKNKYKAGAKGGAIYSSDEEGSDIEDRRSRKSEKAKALKESDDESGSD